jgi:hypothetical protein
MGKISWTDRINNKAVFHRVQEERNILHTMRRRKANWIGHILRRNCLLKHIIEGKIRGKRRRGRRRKQLLDDLKEARRYWNSKEEAQDRILWRTQFGRGYGHVAKQIIYYLILRGMERKGVERIWESRKNEVFLFMRKITAIISNNNSLT